MKSTPDRLFVKTKSTFLELTHGVAYSRRENDG